MNKKWILILLALACAAAVGMGGLFLARKPSLPPEAEDAVDWVGAGEEYAGSAQSPQSIAIPGTDVMQFKANTKEQAVNLYNPAQNNCYFRLSLLLKDGSLLYQSKLLAPGKGLYEITLLEALPEGTYEGSVLKYECFGMDDARTPLNGAELTLTIQSLL